MNISIFFYNILITVAFALNLVAYLMIYTRSRLPAQLYIAIMFGLFAFDNLILYMNEFLPEFSVYYTANVQNFPFLGNMLGFSIVLCYRVILVSDEGKKLTNGEKIFWSVMLAVVVAFTCLYTRDYARIALRILFSALCIGVFLVAYIKRTKKDKTTGGAKKGQGVTIIGSRLVLAAFILQVTETIERFLKLLHLEDMIDNRCVSVEILSILCVGVGLWYAVKALQQTELPQEAARPIEIFAQLEDFANGFSLTNREREVLHLLVSGLSNAEISKAMVISEGTAKTHVHNIYHKLGINSRFRLIKMLADYHKPTL